MAGPAERGAHRRVRSSVVDPPAERRDLQLVEFVEFTADQELEGGETRFSRSARRLFGGADAPTEVTECLVARTNCYVGRNQSQPIENSNSIRSPKKEQTNGDSHRNSYRIAAHSPAFCPV